MAETFTNGFCLKLNDLLEPEQIKSVSKLLYALANEELGHVERLHNAVVGEINAYKSEHGDPPESMQTLYNYLHKRHIDKTAKVKAMVGSYK